ncbi:MAG TPA: LytTR family DNA-binding domain-containing protein [Thermoanaerobaculia bacterium]|nr:LytTR family DNA-binding domain-containing protein [Thermoanaerobaculia bacterium]
MKVVIVDDEPLARKVVRMLVESDRELTIAGECSGIDAAEVITRERPDILFLDIQMPEVDGFDVIERVGADTVPAVVFITAHDDYALRAFEVHALDYLLKPFDDRRFFTALSRAKERVRAKSPSSFVRRFLVRTREKVLLLKSDDLEWIEAADYYVSLHTGGKSYLLRQTMAEIERQLDPAKFVRVHRSAIVNLERVREMHPLFRGDSVLVLTDGTQIRLSRARREEFEKRLAGI